MMLMPRKKVAALIVGGLKQHASPVGRDDLSPNPHEMHRGGMAGYAHGGKVHSPHMSRGAGVGIPSMSDSAHVDTPYMSEGGEVEGGEPDQDLHIACEGVMQAIKSGDVAALCSALKSAFMACDEMPHEEGPHLDEKEGEIAEGGY